MFEQRRTAGLAVTLLTSAVALLTGACADHGAAPTAPPVQSPSVAAAALVLHARTDSLVVGDSLSVALSTGTQSIAPALAHWNSSDSTVLTVSAAGVVSARAAGRARVIAVTDLARAELAIAVGEPVVASLAVLPRGLVLAPGRADSLRVVAHDAAGHAFVPSQLLVASSDEKVVTASGDGRVVARGPGDAMLTMRAGGVELAVPVRVEPARASRFLLDARVARGASPALDSAVARGARRWEQVVVGDLPDVQVELPAGRCGTGTPAIHETVDDLLVFVIADTLDGPGGALASAGPCVGRQETQLPVIGVVRVDVEDLPQLERLGLLDAVVAHELGHVLGLGTLWSAAAHGDLLDASGAYVGVGARTAAAALGFTASDGDSLPLETAGDAGTRALHWQQARFGDELMTGWIGDPAAPLSRVSVAALRDLGYDVAESAADPDVARGASATASSSVDASRATAVRLPLVERTSRGSLVVDAHGRITRVH